MRSSSDGLAVVSVPPTMMIRWKASVCVATSIFLLCCELYGWTRHHSDQVAPTDQLAKKERLQTGSENLVDDFVREEDFPTLAEWLDDREVLYKERARSARLIV